MLRRMMNHRTEENMLNTEAAPAAECGEKKRDGDGRNMMCSDFHRRVTSGSSVGFHDKSCKQPKNQAPPPSNDTTTDIITMNPHHRQALANLYHSSRRSRNFRTVPRSSSALTYAQAQGDQKLLINQDERKKDASIIQDAPTQEEPSLKVEDVEWSFDIASVVDDDCSTVSSFDGEESFMDNDIFRVQSDCLLESEGTKNSISEAVSLDDGLQTSVAGRSYKRLRTT